MQWYAKKVRAATVSLLLVCAICLLGAPARAINAVRVAHRVLYNKIRREAHDRYAIRFVTSHVDRLPNGLRQISGRGIFGRHRKNSQRFTYHTTINIYDGSARHTGYDIQ